MAKAFLSFARVLNIPVRIDWSEGHTIVSDPILNMYGEGHTRKEALDDYRAIIVEYYNELSEDASRLSEHLKQHLHYMERKLSEL